MRYKLIIWRKKWRHFVGCRSQQDFGFVTRTFDVRGKGLINDTLQADSWRPSKIRCYRKRLPQIPVWVIFFFLFCVCSFSKILRAFACHSVLGECVCLAKVFDLLSKQIRQKLRFVRQITVRAPDIRRV